jgi:hypothetical protein
VFGRIRLERGGVFSSRFQQRWLGRDGSGPTLFSRMEFLCGLKRLRVSVDIEYF